MCKRDNGAQPARLEGIILSLSRFVITGGSLLLVVVSGVLASAPLEQDEIVRARGYLSVDRAARGSSFEIAVEAVVSPGWHVNAHEPTDEFLVPTDLVLEAGPGILLGRMRYPAHLERPFAFSETPLAVYEGRIVIQTAASVSETASLGPSVVRGVLTYQACNDETCMPPTEIPVEVPVEIVAAGSPVRPAHPEMFGNGDAQAADSGGRGGRVGAMLRERGFVVGFLVIFVWGLALNLTPCVYPMIPLTVGYFGAQSGGRMSTRFGLAVAYFLGIALMYSTLGLVAAATGGLFGAALQNPAVPVIVAAILVALALSMFGVWEIRLPVFLTKLGGGSRQGSLGAFVMGLTVGIVAAPCIGAVVAALLLYVAETGDLFLGFWMFFALSCGLGLPFLVLAVFSSSISSLPRSGEWMGWVRKLFGFVLVGMAVYFLRPILPWVVGHYLLPLTAVVGAIYLGFIDRTHSTSRTFSWVKGAVGLLGVGVVVWMMMAKTETPGISWERYSDEALQKALADQKPVIIDFSAEWCVPCHELDRFTFTDPRVRGEAWAFPTLKVDLTRSGDTLEQAVKKTYGVMGVPTIIFVEPSGREVRELRVEGFVEPEAFLARMQAFGSR